jgi:hypothetical protein
MWRYRIGRFLAAHGLTHLVGFVGSWDWGALKGSPQWPPLLASLALRGSQGVLGLLWLVGLAALSSPRSPWRRGTAAQVLQSPRSSHVSLSLAWWPSGVVDVAINLAILTVVGIVSFGPQPTPRLRRCYSS